MTDDEVFNENELRSELETKVNEMHALFDESKALSKKLFDSISKAKTLRDEKKKIVDAVRKSKEERAKAQEKVKECSNVLKPLRTQREDVGKVARPFELKKQIESIEWKIWTEPMKYKKEEELTKMRQELEAELEKSQALVEKYKDEKKVRSALMDSLKEQREFHEKVVSESKRWDSISTELTEISKKIDTLKASKKEIDDKITASKKRISEIKNVLGIKEAKDREEVAKENRSKIKDRVEEVKKKFKETGKLSTEDLLILSASGEDLL